MKSISCLILIAVGLGGCSQNPAENNALSPAEFEQKLTASPEAVLLDVRTAEELQGGYIKGAINMDFKRPEFKLLIEGMDKTKPYFVYCASGMRSGKAADLMREIGFTKVTTLEGGLNAWKTAGLSTVTPNP